LAAAVRIEPKQQSAASKVREETNIIRIHPDCHEKRKPRSIMTYKPRNFQLVLRICKKNQVPGVAGGAASSHFNAKTAKRCKARKENRRHEYFHFAVFAPSRLRV
jgi:hypothetical protein